MSNVYYAPGEHRAEKVRELFGRIAGRYDLINDVQSFGMHRRWKQKVVELAAVKQGNKALDVCCGTGDIAFALAECGAEVIGVDFSDEMLGVAKGKSPKSHVQNPKFLGGDAQRLEFPEGTFDAVTVGYGLRNLGSWETGLSEMVRVAKPGGRLLVLEFGKPANPVWSSVYFGYLRFAVPFFGLVFCGRPSAYAYVIESLRNYPAQTGVLTKMQELGLRDAQVINYFGGAMSINYGVKGIH